jgi:hypothetical protein
VKWCRETLAELDRIEATKRKNGMRKEGGRDE